MADLQDTHIHGDLRLDGDILMTLGSTSNASVNEYLNNIHFTVIDTSSKYVKQYDNGWFESWTKSTVPSGDFSYNAMGSSGLYYAAFTNMGIGITAKEVYDVRVSAAKLRCYMDSFLWHEYSYDRYKWYCSAIWKRR